MKFDFDILRTLLQAIAARDPSLLTGYDETTLNSQRELLLTSSFASGGSAGAHPPKGQPIRWTYTHLSLTDAGERLLNLSTNDALWQRAKKAYDFDGQIWSLDDLCAYLESQSNRAPNAISPDA